MSGDRLFHWPVVPLIIITLGVVASVGLVAKNLVPPRGGPVERLRARRVAGRLERVLHLEGPGPGLPV